MVPSKKLRAFILGLTCSILTPAAPTFAIEQKGAAEIQLLNPRIDARSLEKKHPSLKVKTISQSSNLHPKALFTSAERSSWIRKADLTNATQSWDELDRDLLILRAHSYEPEKLRSTYPNLPEAKLKTLQTIIKSRGGK